MSRIAASPGDAPLSERPFRLSDYPMQLFGYIRQMNYVAMQEVLAPLGSTAHEWRVLASLQEIDQQTMSSLAGYTVIERTYLTKIVAKMEADGLVTRVGDKSDRRLVRISITGKGLKLFRRILPVARSHFEKTLGSLTAAERQTLMGLLQKVAAGLDKFRERHPL